MAGQDSQRVVLGRIAAAFGVKGWVKLQSWTDPPEKIIAYRPWLLERGGAWREALVAEGRVHGNSVVARIEGVSDRDQAATLAGTNIAVYREQLPALEPGQYYWADLIGLEVRLEDGRSLGRVTAMMATGANDVLVVRGERERLIPFLRGQVVKQVDSDARLIRVDWDPDF